MTASLASRLQRLIVSLWTQVDVEEGYLSANSCTWLCRELKELQKVPVPPGCALVSPDADQTPLSVSTLTISR